MQLINIHRFHSDNKNKDYEVIQLLRPLTAREKNNGYVGSGIFEEKFLPDNLIGQLSNSDIGTEIELIYEVYGNKAELVEIVKGGK